MSTDFDIPDILRQLKLAAGDISPYAPEKPLPFRPLVQKLVWHEAPEEAFELAMHFLQFHSIPHSVALNITRVFVASLPQYIVQTEMEADQRRNELAGDFFTKAVVHELRQCIGKLHTKEDLVNLGALQLPRHNCDPSSHLCLHVSIACQKNQRRTMEDRHTALLDLQMMFGDRAVAGDALFCVYDGHAGSEIASYAVTHFPYHLTEAPDYRTDLQSALRYAYERIDNHTTEKCKREKIRSGCTAVTCLLRGKQLHVGWVGDSHAVLIDARGPTTLTTAHNPDLECEYKRIEAAGGMCIPIQGELRVNGVLNLSRSFGDVAVKPCVTAEPDVVCVDFNGSETLLLLCCDGVWDSMEDEQFEECLTQFVQSMKSIEQWMTDYTRLSELIIGRAKANGSTDNLTCVAVLLKPLEKIWQQYRKT